MAVAVAVAAAAVAAAAVAVVVVVVMVVKSEDPPKSILYHGYLHAQDLRSSRTRNLCA